MKPIKEVVNDSEWQKLRLSFIGTWKTTPTENILKLREYIGDGSDPLKVRRIHNYLTGSAFRIGIISHPEITKFLNEVKQLKRI